jgi:hypothetical protein
MVDNRHQAGLDSPTVANSMAPFLNDKSCTCAMSMSHMSSMDISGVGMGAEGTNGPSCACAWGWQRNNKGTRCYEEYTVHGGAENLHNVVMSNGGRELCYPMVRENNRARPVRQYCAVLTSFTVRPKVDRGCLNLFHHYDFLLLCDLVS